MKYKWYAVGYVLYFLTVWAWMLGNFGSSWDNDEWSKFIIFEFILPIVAYIAGYLIARNR